MSDLSEQLIREFIDSIADVKLESKEKIEVWTPNNSLYRLKIDEFEYDYHPDELFLIGDSFLADRGLVRHHKDSADNLYNNGIHQIVSQGFKVEKRVMNERNATQEDKDIEYIDCEVSFTNVELLPPSTVQYSTGKSIILYPRVALEREKVYSGLLMISCEIRATARLRNGNTISRVDQVKNFRIARMPIVKGSILCNTYGKSAEALAKLGEDPADPGGYFIIQGNEYISDCSENIVMNQPTIFINKGYENYLAYCVFISKPGDTYQNSEQLRINFYNNFTLYFEVANKDLKEQEIPFYLVFRIMGWGNDKDMFDHIVCDYDDVTNKRVMNLLVKSMEAKYVNYDAKNTYNQIDAIKAIIATLPRERYKHLDLANKPENYQQLVNDIMKVFDVHCLPHIGTTAEYRQDKLRFMALLVRKLLLCYLEQIPQTDRDSYRNKRIHAVGENYAKAIKTYFNQTVVLPIKRRIIKDFKNASFSQVNLPNIVTQSIYADEFERLIVKTINAGNRATMMLKKRSLINRMAAQPLGRRNQMDTLATLRQVSATSSSIENAKQSERAAEMRRVHMSFLGYICCVHSTPEGEKVGINKQLAIFATIAPGSSSEVLKQILKKDPLLLRLDSLTPFMIARNHFSRVFVNGDWIGCVQDSCKFIEKYKKLRRNLAIHPYTTIYWDNTQDEVMFWVDVGRLTRPLMIVYNKERDPEAFASKTINDTKSKKSKNNGAAKPKKSIKGGTESFEQGVAITRRDIEDLYCNRKTINDLVREQKIEFITPEEQENCYVCPSMQRLKEDKNNPLKEYTHCDIPQAILSLTALSSPFAHHNQTTRLTYQTSQVKQTCGYYALNWPHRMDKETFLQYINEMPLIRTYANKYIFPNGCNVMMAIMCCAFAQEDSLVMNKAAVDRGLFYGCKFTNYKAELEQKEELGNPDAAKTADLKSANYSKLVEGIVPKGSVVKPDDVIIGKYVALQKNKDEKFSYSDRSIIYKGTEDAIVHQRITDRNDDDELFAKVALRKLRKIIKGDKMSSRAGQKGICALLMREEDLPFTKDGMRPMVIFNSLGMPSRMTISTYLEVLMGNLCAHKGVNADCSIFKENNIDIIADELEKCGMHRYGYERMYHGITGEYIDSLIFYGPTYYQRLQKFVADTEYSVRHPATDAITMQPSDGGRGTGGGLKIGEMEKDVLVSHGIAAVINEKFYSHSDGYTEYICRCGKAAIVNHKDKLYKCNYCRDNADIAAVPTSWASKLFTQELESANIGIRRVPKPFQFEVFDTPERAHTRREIRIDHLEALEDIDEEEKKE